MGAGQPVLGYPTKHPVHPTPPPQNVMTKVSEDGTVFGPGGEAPSVLPGFRQEGTPWCSPGGACSGAPAAEVFDPETRALVRINIPYYPAGCCGQHRGIAEQYEHSAPEGLKSRGIDDATWKTWTGRHGLGKVQAFREPCCPGVCICLLLLPCWCCLLKG